MHFPSVTPLANPKQLVELREARQKSDLNLLRSDESITSPGKWFWQLIVLTYLQTSAFSHRSLLHLCLRTQPRKPHPCVFKRGALPQILT